MAQNDSHVLLVLAVVRNPRMAQKAAIISDDSFSFISKLRATRDSGAMKSRHFGLSPVSKFLGDKQGSLKGLVDLDLNGDTVWTEGRHVPAIRPFHQSGILMQETGYSLPSYAAYYAEYELAIPSRRRRRHENLMCTADGEVENFFNRASVPELRRIASELGIPTRLVELIVEGRWMLEMLRETCYTRRSALNLKPVITTYDTGVFDLYPQQPAVNVL
ncbi:hypothetical protein GGX14DRAFT_406671 [Mycena pura]|uniref:Uncharacterized protein n=1 Tax=Mycena pura TaxID=153505 RepID=A0AAD6USX5_9AGAR|nr:hypothetical protein GGX14DRAFT_406671 [Mycena pura]